MKSFFCCLLLLCVFSVDLHAQKKPEFTYPDDVVADTAKKSFVKHFNQGKILYGIACSKCHNMPGKDGKLVVPDFSLPQLLDYEMRMAYPEHVDNLPDAKVADVEMQKIILYLQYKSRTGVTIHPPPKEN